MIVGHSPNPQPLDRISPTVANALLACPLRVAFQRDQSLQPLTKRPRPDAALGAATHALAEAASRGEFDRVAPAQLQAEVSSFWDSQVDVERASFDQMDLLARMPPPSRWPFFAIKRARAVRYAEAIVNARTVADSTGVAAGGVRAEVALVSDDPPLVGRVDRVERGVGGICLVDIKTGAAPHEDGSLDPPHRTQLLLYAALYKSATGEAPQSLAIQYLDGTRTLIPIDWHEVDAAVRGVLTLRDSFNSLINVGTQARWESVAKPDQTVCLHCDFEPVCGPFLSYVAPIQPAFAACAVGQVEEIAPSGETVVMQLRVEALKAEDAGSECIAILGVPPALAPAPGRRVSVCWATRAANERDLRVTWQSRLHAWPAG